MTGSALNAFSSNVEVLNSKIFGPSAPIFMGEGMRAVDDTKASDFRCKQYLQIIYGYVTG